MIAAWLIRETGNPISPAYYLTACVAVSAVALFFFKETANKPFAPTSRSAFNPLPFMP